jgi:hypothetical protein
MRVNLAIIFETQMNAKSPMRSLSFVQARDFRLAPESPPTRQLLVGKQRHAPSPPMMLPQSFFVTRLLA